MATRWVVMALVAAGWALLGPSPATAGSVEGGSGSTLRWGWPLQPGPPVVAGFDPPAGPYSAGHRGVDLAASVGQPVLSAGAGVVAYAGQVVGRGVVSVNHPGGLRSTYEPVSFTVRGGDVVSPGQRLGAVSAAPGHCLPGTCLHWGLRVGEVYLDPLGLLDAARRVRLLPLWVREGPLVPGGPAGATVTRAAAPPDRGPLLARG